MERVSFENPEVITLPSCLVQYSLGRKKLENRVLEIIEYVYDTHISRKEYSEGRVFAGPLLSEPISQLSVAQRNSVLNWFEIGLACLLRPNCGQTLCAYHCLDVKEWEFGTKVCSKISKMTKTRHDGMEQVQSIVQKCQILGKLRN